MTDWGWSRREFFFWQPNPLVSRRSFGLRGICAFLIGVNLYFVVQFTACCFIERRKNAVAGYGIAAVTSSILLASVKPSFALAAIFVLLPVGLFFFRAGLVPAKNGGDHRHSSGRGGCSSHAGARSQPQ